MPDIEETNITICISPSPRVRGRRAHAAGADGFLVGTALMRADKPGEKLKELFKMSEEDKALAAAFDQQRRLAEEQIWLQLEALEIPPRDLLGQVVTRYTHEILWEPTGVEHKRPDGSVVCEMRPYIQPIKSEYEK